MKSQEIIPSHTYMHVRAHACTHTHTHTHTPYVNIAQNSYGALIWKMKEAMEKFQLQSWQV